MRNLIKYEFRKSWMVKAIILTITAIFEVMFLTGVVAGNDNVAFSGALFLVFTTICSIFIIGVLSVFVLHKDLNTKQSYMLFMTPNSTYKILGAKIIENFGSIILAGVMFFVLAVVDISIWSAKSEGVKGTIDFVGDIIGLATKDGIQLDILHIAITTADSLVSWVFVVMVGFFAVVLSACFFNGRKFNGLLSFVIFLVVTIVINKIFDTSSVMIFGANAMYAIEARICSIVYYLVLTTVLYIVTAGIMDRKLSV